MNTPPYETPAKIFYGSISSGGIYAVEYGFDQSYIVRGMILTTEWNSGGGGVLIIYLNNVICITVNITAGFPAPQTQIVPQCHFAIAGNDSLRAEIFNVDDVNPCDGQAFFYLSGTTQHTIPWTLPS